jgi:hypothetical protein
MAARFPSEVHPSIDGHLECQFSFYYQRTPITNHAQYAIVSIQTSSCCPCATRCSRAEPPDVGPYLTNSVASFKYLRTRAGFHIQQIFPMGSVAIFPDESK